MQAIKGIAVALGLTHEALARKLADAFLGESVATQPPQDERGHGLSDERILAGVKEFADENYYANYKDDILRCVRTLLAASAPAQQATPPQPVAADVEKDAARYRFLRMDAGIRNERPFIAISAAGGISQWTGIFADKQIDNVMAGTGSDKSRENGND